MSIRPTRFELRVGGFGGPSYAVRLIAGQLQYEHGDEGFTPPDLEVIDPSDGDWAGFWKTIEALHVREWEESFENPNVLDGTWWEVDIQLDGRAVTASGSNAYPPNGTGPEKTREWRRFCNAVRALVGGRPFG